MQSKENLDFTAGRGQAVREYPTDTGPAEQTEWFKLIRDHLVASLRFTREDLDYAPFDGKGGLGKMHQLFGDRMETVMDQVNRELTA